MKLSKVLLVAAAAVSMAHAKYVEFNHELARSYADNGITFLADIMEVETKALMASSVDRISCSVKEETKIDQNVKVVLAISKCVTDAQLTQINDWIAKIKDNDHLLYFKDGKTSSIQFETRVVESGSCQALGERNAAGRADTEFSKHFDNTWEQGGVQLLAHEAVTEHDVSRMAVFANYGRVLAGMADPPAATEEKSTATIGVISFVTDDTSYKVVQQYERINKIEKTFNFQICKSGTNCDGAFTNCIQLPDVVDVFMYNPFTVTRCFHCAKLPGGVPVSYVAADGSRQCFCSCPAGYAQKKDASGNWYCQQYKQSYCECEWKKRMYGYKHEVTTELKTCSFDHVATTWGVDVPFPSDNYVADSRVNANDDGDVTKGPHVTLTQYQSYDKIVKWDDLLPLLAGKSSVKKPSEFDDSWEEGTEKVPDAEKAIDVDSKADGPSTVKDFTWKDYQKNRVAKIDDLSFKAYGEYELKLFAKDYSKDDTCEGCLAIVDKYRPRHSTECPKSFCDKSQTCDSLPAAVAEMTGANLVTANGLVKAFYDYGEMATNDACGSPRCDDQSFSIQNFFESTFAKDDYASGKKCFDTDIARSEFLANAKATANPLVDKAGKPVDTDNLNIPQCTRCCSYSTSLKEWWVDYTCGKDYSFEYCEGLPSEHCEFKQCLSMDGNTLATAAARIRKAYADESANVIAALPEKGYQPHTQIHRALQCTDFGAKDGECSFTSTIAAMIETDVAANFDFKGKNVKDYVFWRYRVKGEAGWSLFSQNKNHVFTTAETKIELEAWSNCGLVRRFLFYVILHPHTDVRPCEYFEDMFYQTSVSPAKLTMDICAYPQSDFAELTFDYHANVGLKYAGDKLQMKISGVQCTLQYFNTEKNGKIVPDLGPAAKIVDVVKDSPEIVKRFAVELINKPATQATTRFEVACTFSYTRYDKTAAATQTCSKRFSVVDCDQPWIDIPDGECRHDACAGSPDKAGPFEACGGNVVRWSPTSTYLDTSDKQCCQSCSKTTSCIPILGMPSASDDIKRCEPEGGNGGHGGVYTSDVEYNFKTYNDKPALLLEAATSLVSAGSEHVTLLAVVGGSALVALVALVVAKRRRAAEAKAEAVEDGYYPLLY